jgi:GT2 family glycosyltransferase
LVESEWTFLADDDIRFQEDLIENAFVFLEKYKGNIALNLLCLLPNQKQTYFTTSQTDIFGSGTSILKSSVFKKVKFDMAFENGFGEDSDFGMQIRKQGMDIIYTPNIKITHLKAPIGGFRNKTAKLWDDEILQPKPSPTLMVFAKKHYNNTQVKGYKYVLFVKFYRNQSTKNPYKYLKQMNSKWRISEKWAKVLQLKNEVI